MKGKQADATPEQTIRRSLNRRILRNTTLNILVLVVVSCVIMALSMQSLANSILLDSLQPMVRQSAKTVEANIHMLADRMMTIAGDPRMGSGTDQEPADYEQIRESRMAVLEEAAEIYELHTIALYDQEGKLADMAEELSGQSGQLHAASLEQNQSAEALVLEVSHVKEQLANVTESSSQTRAKTEEITRRIETANTKMTALSGAMDDISTHAREITKIAKAIEDIAFQTSILALNASVEAARAGSAGSGFAVVADEVQQLAARSSEAAKSATSMVENTRAIISTGVELNVDTADSLKAISDVSSQISEISDRLVEAVQGQENALSVMEERIGTISGIADRNLQNAEGTEKSSGLLAREAEKLQIQVKNFVLKEEHNR